MIQVKVMLPKEDLRQYTILWRDYLTYPWQLKLFSEERLWYSSLESIYNYRVKTEADNVRHSRTEPHQRGSSFGR
jgi:hypothetical protein